MQTLPRAHMNVDFWVGSAPPPLTYIKLNGFPALPTPAFLRASTAAMGKSRWIFMYSSSERPLTDFPSVHTQPSWSAIWEITSSEYWVKSSTIIVLDFSLAFEGSSAHEGTSRRRRRVMWDTDGSARAARYAANPAGKREFNVSYIAWWPLVREVEKYLFQWHQ